MTRETYTMDSLPPGISASLREALAEYFAEHGKLPPHRKWLKEFGPDHAPSNDRNCWMLM